MIILDILSIIISLYIVFNFIYKFVIAKNKHEDINLYYNTKKTKIFHFKKLLYVF